MTRVQRFLRPRFTDPDVDTRSGAASDPDRWFVSLAEVEARVAHLQAEFLVPRDAAWVVEEREEEVEIWPDDTPVVLIEEEVGASHWVWTPERTADALIAFWGALPSMSEPYWLHAERKAGRVREARLLGSPGFARVEGRVIEVPRPWTAHVWREHDSWLRPPLPTSTRYLHAGAVLPVVDSNYHFAWSQIAFREAGVCGRVDFSPNAVAVGVCDEPIGQGHVVAMAALSLGRLNGIAGPAMEIEVEGGTRVVPAQRLLRWSGSTFECVPADAAEP